MSITHVFAIFAQMDKDSMLVIGAGELGTEILECLANHLSFDPSKRTLTVLLRPSSVESASPEKQVQLQHFRDLDIGLTLGDIDHDSLEHLRDIFSSFSTVIHAAGMTSPPGTMTKVTKAVLEARVGMYIPWQHGVDYDVIGREGGQGMFSEQIGVREMLRAQSATHWLIISCGIFMSFLFEDFWGVVSKRADGTIQVNALNSWEDMVTATTARDIGRCTAELLLKPDMPRDQPVYIAGDTMTYSDFAGTVQRESGMDVVREVWPLEYLRAESERCPEDKLKRYRVVFAEGRGVSWPKESSWNAKNNVEMEGFGDWVKANCR